MQGNVPNYLHIPSPHVPRYSGMTESILTFQRTYLELLACMHASDRGGNGKGMDDPPPQSDWTPTSLSYPSMDGMDTYMGPLMSCRVVSRRVTVTYLARYLNLPTCRACYL